MRKRAKLASAIAGALLLAGLAGAQSLDIPIRVVEIGNEDRAEFVTTGVPLPIDLAIRSTRRLGVFADNGHEQVTQFKVLARWHGSADDATRPIKWLLVTFKVSLIAVSERTFHLRDTSPPAKRERPQMVSSGTDEEQVNTGPLQFTISKKRGNLFDKVTIDGRPVVQSSTTNGFVIRDYLGNTFSSGRIAPTEVVVEENGIHRAVIRVSGTHSDGQNTLLEYTVRIHAYRGERAVRVFYSLRNSQSYGYQSKAVHEHLMDVRLDLGCQLGSQSATVAFRDESYTLATNQSREMQQDMAGATDTSMVTDSNGNLHDNFIRRIVDEWNSLVKTVGGQDDGNETGRDPGYMNISRGDAGVVVGLRDFWQNFPKSLTARGDGSISIGILPEFGYYVDDGTYQRDPAPQAARDDYTFGGGRQKTHEIYLHFYGDGNDPGLAAVRRFNTPLSALAWPSAFVNSRAIEYAVDARDWFKHSLFTTDQSLDFDRWERFQRMKWDPTATDYQQGLGHVTYHEFRRRGGTYGGNQFYGWMNFGDTPWGDGYCQGHYDWPYSTMFSAIRAADPTLFELAKVMVRHRMDIDQYHTTADRSDLCGGQRFEKGMKHGDMTMPPMPSHTWIHGLLLYWAVTGDEFAKEAALEALPFYRVYWTRVRAPFYGVNTEFRTGGWSLMGLTELYDYCYETDVFPLAQRIIQGYINHENTENTSGYFLGANTSGISAWMNGIFLNGLGKYYHHTGQKDVAARGLLDRIANWFTSGQNAFGPLKGGTGSASNYTPYSIYYNWDPDPNVRNTLVRANMAHIIDGLSYVYLATGKDRYQDVAGKVASDIWRYYTTNSKTVDRNDPKALEPITMRNTMFPGSESKILGWLTRYGNIVHYAEYMRKTNAPILCEVLPKNAVDAWASLRFRVTRNQPIAPAGWRTYSGQLRAGGIDVTGLVGTYFQHDASPFHETWFLPVGFMRNEQIMFDLMVWDGPLAHQVVQAVGRSGID